MDIKFSPGVSDAMAWGVPAVALESTVISHGLPYPQNLQAANDMESIIRAKGAVPATIAILNGEICVGLDASQIEGLASGNGVRKISRRDLAIAVANNLDCATTVATTALIAHEAGIRVFATGGIGGVHRGFDADVSADLPELARTPITVVCSGAKIVLDLERTREWLETFGVAVLGWRCDDLPAFYSRSSGLAVDQRVENAADVAAIVAARDRMGLESSVLVTVPVPSEYELNRDELENILTASLELAAEQGVKGKQITPFLLAEMSTRSGGKTLEANIALLKNNASVAAEIAIALRS